jgi:hypothetical protein
MAEGWRQGAQQVRWVSAKAGMRYGQQGQSADRRPIPASMLHAIDAEGNAACGDQWPWTITGSAWPPSIDPGVGICQACLEATGP